MCIDDVEGVLDEIPVSFFAATQGIFCLSAIGYVVAERDRLGNLAVDEYLRVLPHYVAFGTVLGNDRVLIQARSSAGRQPLEFLPYLWKPLLRNKRLEPTAAHDLVSRVTCDGLGHLIEYVDLTVGVEAEYDHIGGLDELIGKRLCPFEFLSSACVRLRHS